MPKLGADEFVLRPRAGVVGVVRPTALLQHDDRDTSFGDMQRRHRTRRTSADDSDVDLLVTPRSLLLAIFPPPSVSSMTLLGPRRIRSVLCGKMRGADNDDAFDDQLLVDGQSEQNDQIANDDQNGNAEERAPTLPRPPESATPPITAATMLSNSYPWPTQFETVPT